MTLAFYAGMMLLVILLILLPRQVAGWVFLALVIVSLGGLAYLNADWFKQRGLQNLFFSSDPTPPMVLPAWLTKLQPLLIVAELTLITFFTFHYTEAFWKNDPNQTLPGREVEWQVNPAYVAAEMLNEHGYLPLWNPYLEYGHPLIDNSQSFIMNPFASVPSLLWGGVRGIKLGVGIHALIAAWGGWFLGRVLGLGAPGRVLLALLMLGKGNMLAMFGAGYYQLAVGQAYLPFITAGTLAILRNEGRRWPVALTAIALTLQFWGGSIWYSLPTALFIILLALMYLFFYEGRKIHGSALRNLLLAGVLTANLSAITLLPLWLQREYLGDHPSDTTGGTVVELGKVIEQFYNGDISLYKRNEAPGEAHFYYSFILPLWFGVLIFIAFPPIPRFLHRESQSQTWRLWVVAVFMIIAMTLWGAGGNDFIIALYENIELLGQWRFVGRALGVASFWIGVLVALRVDGLWQVIWSLKVSTLRPFLMVAGQIFLSVLLLVASWTAAREINGSWKVFAGTVSRDYWANDRECVTWLREKNPDAYLSAYQYGYEPVISYLENRVVMWDIEADFEPLPLTPTLSHELVMQTRPEYAVTWTRETRRVIENWGYEPVPDGPTPVDDNACLYRREGALPFTFTVPLSTLQTYEGPLQANQTFPATLIEHLPDRITIEAKGYPVGSRVAVVQQLAHPGWEVKLDGKYAYLESVGGLLGVLLPRDTQTHTIEFAYRPPLVLRGAWLSLLTCAFLILYLLRADRLMAYFWHKPTNPPIHEGGQNLTDEQP